MENIHKYTLYLGDLHFHTHYSDNRDRASIEEMIHEGMKYNLSIFGTADHNHNLDAKKWKQTLEETKLLRGKYPEILIFNNCEITFLLGHLNVLLPEHIEGTIEEGYQYLYLNENALKIINHPFPSNDEWHRRILPDAIGVEVINGSVFAHARKQGYYIHSAIDIPSVRTYATYLSSGIPVAAIGGSDAHRKAELGFGMTGFWLAGKPDSQAVTEAIIEKRTFAATKSNITLHWEFNEVNREISWSIFWKNSSSLNGDATVEIYHNDRKINTLSSNGSGKISVIKAGFYWIAVFDEDDIAISSPIHVKREYPDETRHPHLGVLHNAIYSIHQDVTWLTITAEQIFSKTTLLPLKQSLKLQMISSTDTPCIVDADGRDVPYEVISKGTPRIIIDKTCGASGFEEFYLWLERNEIHEYVFAKIQYQKIEQTVWFRGDLLPKKMVCRKGIHTLYHNDLVTLKTLIDMDTDIKIHVSTLPTLIIRLDPNNRLFPLKAFDTFPEVSSVFYYDEDETVRCPEHILDRLEEGLDIGKLPVFKRIYQFFV